MKTAPAAPKNLIVVAGHAPFRESVVSVPENPQRDEAWVLQSFQRGEPPLYIEHIQRGVDLLRADPEALLIFSGGFTRAEAGLRWSEAETYAALARHFNWWATNACKRSMPCLASCSATEDFSRDSFENLLFSLCRFQQVTGKYPRRVTMVSWAFKGPRFDMHRAAIRFPAGRFHYEGCNQPLTLETALRGEAITVREFMENRYGASQAMLQKRANRNPFRRRHEFDLCPGLMKFFAFMSDEANGQKDFPDRLPWET
jgi:hypothetical protein